MSEPARTLILPWLRVGVGAGIARVDGGPATAAPPAVTVELSVNQGLMRSAFSASLAGPGDVAAVDPGAFVRVWPAPDATDAESNLLPLVEIVPADLPWRFTPARADARDRLRPWICLAVFRDDEVRERDPPVGNRPLPAFTVVREALPDARASWAWAHAQVNGADRLDEGALAGLLAEQPLAARARLLAPRRLEPGTAYLAAVIPTLEAARLAGLGEPVPTSLDPLAPAWTPQQASVRLPVYHSWRFATGPGGDFETLVHRLRPATSTIDGFRLVDASEPGAGLPPPSSGPIAAEGALSPPSMQRPSWDTDERTRWEQALVDVLHAAERGPSIAPPIYGAEAAETARLDDRAPRWLRELNLDPAARAAAGLGTEVVQAERHHLLTAAWEQLGGDRIPERIRLAQLSHEVSRRLYARHLPESDSDALLSVTTALHDRLTSGSSSVSSLLQRRTLASSVTSAAWRRLTRALGPTARRLPQRARRNPLIERIGRDELRIASAAPLPSGLARMPRLPGAAPRTTPFGAAFAALEAARGRPRTPRAPTASLDPARIALDVRRALDPRHTIAARFAARLRRPRGEAIPDALAPLRAAPVFPQPLASALAERSVRWIIPDVDRVAPDSVSVLTVNARFVEAFLVGANHALARELAWERYPLDRRATSFRTFFADGTLDIPPIAAWRHDAALGDHVATTARGRLALVVRGGVLARYPAMQVYAVRARRAANGAREPGDEERLPRFAGNIPPDIGYFGFELSLVDARGDHDGLGWFFVFQEPPSEPRFGLDAGEPPQPPARAWKDLSWGHTAADPAALARLAYLDLDAELPDTRQIQDPASVVWHADAGLGATGATAAHLAYALTRRRVRVAIHAADLLPEA